MDRKVRAGALAIVAVGGLLAGCSDSTDSTDSQGVEGAATTTITAATVDASTTTNAPAVTSEVVTTDAAGTTGDAAGAPAVPEGIAEAVAALETAAAAVPDGQPFDLEDDTFQGERVWDIKVASGAEEYELVVSRDGTTVLDQRRADKPDDDVVKVESASVSAIEALTIAAGEVGGSVSEMEIDSMSDGTIVWEVEMRQSDGIKVELTIDASTGDILRRG